MNAEQFRGARQKIKYTVAECAAAFDVTPRAVRNWEDESRAIPGPAGVLMQWLSNHVAPYIPPRLRTPSAQEMIDRQEG